MINRNIDEEAQVQKHFGLVVSQAQKYYKYDQCMELEDYIQIGSIGLLKAIRNYSEDRKAKFSVFAFYCIRNEILRQLGKENKHKKTYSVDDFYLANSLEDKDAQAVDKIAEAMPSLTNTETVLITMRAEGYTRSEICSTLGLTKNEFKTHFLEIIRKIRNANK
jgi:RNA polymerase sigma factor (sigma-70 family)